MAERRTSWRDETGEGSLPELSPLRGQTPAETTAEKLQPRVHCAYCGLSRIVDVARLPKASAARSWPEVLARMRCGTCGYPPASLSFWRWSDLVRGMVTAEHTIMTFDPRLRTKKTPPAGQAEGACVSVRAVP